MHVLDRDRVLRPARARLPEALAAVEGVSRGDEAWERLEARGLLPSGTVDERGRVFGGWMISYDHKRTWHAVERRSTGNVFAQRLATDERAPPTVGLACALASDWTAVLQAEALAREVYYGLRPWRLAAGHEAPAVQWRLGLGSDGRGDVEQHCGDLWFARVRLIAFSGREIADAGEVRARLAERPARAIGELCAIEDAYFAGLWRELLEELRRARVERDELRAARGLPPLGDAAPTEWEDDAFGQARMPVARAVQQRYAQRFSRLIGPSMARVPNVFDTLVALWNTGYAPVLFTAHAIVLEAPPLDAS